MSRLIYESQRVSAASDAEPRNVKVHDVHSLRRQILDVEIKYSFCDGKQPKGLDRIADAWSIDTNMGPFGEMLKHYLD